MLLPKLHDTSESVNTRDRLDDQPVTDEEIELCLAEAEAIPVPLWMEIQAEEVRQRIASARAAKYTRTTVPGRT